MSRSGKKGNSTAPRDVSLNVLSEKKANRAKPHSRMGRFRAGVLVLVHLLILAHIVQWVVTGSTVSPVEPSESMGTLELGEINAGFIFFLVAILATLVFGRYFCGWGCHIVALQDACTWMMNKSGVRPKPFRSRLLVWAPLIFGLYMFVWPVFKRAALFPALQGIGIEVPIWLGPVAEFHGFENGIIVEDFWATFPPWYVAVPFFLVVGFGAVYFLGSKGFCTYGCPYGGIFGAVDRVSPGRIIVDHDACEQCGHCTAVCTSNVRVAEEVHDFGMVMDPGCMKCMDCVSACPNDALKFGFTTPAKWRQPVDDEAKARRARIAKNPKRFDLTWPEEIALAVIFVFMFLAFRGMLNMIPMLMAAGMAGIGTFAAWKLWALVSKQNVRLQNLVLKSKGRLRASGMAAGAIALFVVASSVWSGWVNVSRFRAHAAHESLSVPLSIVLRDQFVPTPEMLETAQAGASMYATTLPFDEGGFGWALNAEQKRKHAYFALMLGSEAQAEAMLRDILEEGNPTESLILQLASLMERRGADANEVLSMLRGAFDAHEELEGLAPDIALRLTRSTGGDTDAAFDFWDEQIARRTDNTMLHLQAAEFSIAAARWDRVELHLSHVDFDDLETAQELITAGRIRAKQGQAEATKSLLERAADAKRVTPGELGVVISLLTAIGAHDDVDRHSQEAIWRHDDSVGLLQSVAVSAMSRGDTDTSRAAFQRAATVVEDSPWELLSLGESAVRMGLAGQDRATSEVGLQAMLRARELEPESVLILHDLGQAMIATGDFDAGLGLLEQAAKAAPDQEALARSLAQARERINMLRESR